MYPFECYPIIPLNVITVPLNVITLSFPWGLIILSVPSEKTCLWPLLLFSQDKVTSEITMYHATYLFQTPSGITQETVNRKGQARICRLEKFHLSWRVWSHFFYEQTCWERSSSFRIPVDIQRNVGVWSFYEYFFGVQIPNLSRCFFGGEGSKGRATEGDSSQKQGREGH